MEEKDRVTELLEEEEQDLTTEDVEDDPDKTKSTVDKSNEDENPEGDEKPEKTKQTREENAKFAELRRQKAELEKEKKELEAKVQKANFNAKKDGVSKATLEGIGLDTIETEEDLVLATAYDNAIAEGSEDPLKDAIKVQREHIRKTAEKTRSEEEARKATIELIKQDQANFKEKFGMETSEVYGKDERFMALFGDLLQPGNFTQLYTRYKEAFPDESSDEEAKNKGALPTAGNKAKKKTTKKELHELDDDEFLKAWNEKYSNQPLERGNKRCQ